MNDQVKKLRARARRELDCMQVSEGKAGFGSPEDDPTGLQLLRTAAMALESHLATAPVHANDKEFVIGAHALLMLEEAIERLDSLMRLQLQPTKGTA